jgi:hypothetical protein
MFAVIGDDAVRLGSSWSLVDYRAKVLLSPQENYFQCGLHFVVC